MCRNSKFVLRAAQRKLGSPQWAVPHGMVAVPKRKPASAEEAAAKKKALEEENYILQHSAVRTKLEGCDLCALKSVITVDYFDI